mgnify:CR=1 FL=1
MSAWPPMARGDSCVWQRTQQLSSGSNCWQRRAPLRTSAPLEKLHAEIRKIVEPYEKDRFFAPDIEAAKNLVMSGALATQFADFLPDTLES